MFTPTSPLPVIAAILLALATVKLLSWRFGGANEEGRFVTIDGLRGYLAFFVFIHHSCVWYFYLKTSEWQNPPSNFFIHFGQSSVTLFFMITGFLFSTKIIEDRRKGIDWVKLYVSRILRLAPLYLFTMVLLFMMVAVISAFTLNESPVALAAGALKWLGFTIFGAPDLNGVDGTAGIVAGVTWSLCYEWMFYLCLPLLSVAFGVIPPIPALLIALIGVWGFATMPGSLVHVMAFVSGAVSALLVRQPAFTRIAARRSSSVVVIVALAIAITFFPTAYSRFPFILLSVSFALVAGGATLFGALSSTLSRTLGEMAYSLYLLHGFVLFTFFNFIIGRRHASLLSPSGYWLLILAVTPVLVVICFATFRLIEKPSMQYTARVTGWFRQLMLTRRGGVEESL
ncbi:acyltransferase [Paraburkholderia sp. J67]|uniref:acyltransferase family protein n=1 Tax=Paraburkholderia sp. J67 TaxID=2805435 RepID=UPI002ABD72E8|nr:acyltransferase [Paraburkholderia sp. J67]